MAVLAVVAVVAVCAFAKAQDAEFKAEQQARIDASTVVAYQVAEDGAMQITFADGTGYYFEDMNEVVDHIDEILNFDFIVQLKDSYEGHNDLVKLQLLQLNMNMTRAEMFGSC